MKSALSKTNEKPVLAKNYVQNDEIKDKFCCLMCKSEAIFCPSYKKGNTEVSAYFRSEHQNDCIFSDKIKYPRKITQDVLCGINEGLKYNNVIYGKDISSFIITKTRCPKEIKKETNYYFYFQCTSKRIYTKDNINRTYVNGCNANIKLYFENGSENFEKLNSFIEENEYYLMSAPIESYGEKKYINIVSEVNIIKISEYDLRRIENEFQVEK